MNNFLGALSRLMQEDLDTTPEEDLDEREAAAQIIRDEHTRLEAEIARLRAELKRLSEIKAEAPCARCGGKGFVSSTCPDPQCGDSTWDHYCQLGDQILCPACRPMPQDNDDPDPPRHLLNETNCISPAKDHDHTQCIEEAPPDSPNHMTCPGCRNSIDPTTCWCGTRIPHNAFEDGHAAVPMGCDCFAHP